VNNEEYRLIKKVPSGGNYKKMSRDLLKEEFGAEFGDPNSIKMYELLSDSNKKKNEKEEEKEEKQD
jgi:hypothetical protein